MIDLLLKKNIHYIVGPAAQNTVHEKTKIRNARHQEVTAIQNRDLIPSLARILEPNLVLGIFLVQNPVRKLIHVALRTADDVRQTLRNQGFWTLLEFCI